MNIGLKPGIILLNVLLGLLATGLLLLAAVSGNAQDQRPAEKPTSTEFLNTLSAQERAWLRDHSVIRVAQDPSWPPIEFADERGTPSGMTADYLGLVEGRLGVKFQQVKNLSWQEAYARMQRWEIDMTTSVAVTSERETFWAFTKPYMTIPIVIVTRSDVSYVADLRELEGKKVAVVSGYVAETWMARDYPEIQLVRVQTTQEALAMLQRGEVFACVENMLVVGHSITKLKISGLKITGSTPYNNAQSMAVRKDWAILAGILDQALDSISATERNTIFRKWLPLQYQSASDYTRLWPVAAILALVLMGLVTWNWKLAAEIRQRKQAEAALKMSKELLSETERVGKVGGWSFNIDTMAQIWTDEVYLIHEIEISPNPCIDKGINYYTKESRKIIEKAVQRAIEFGEEFDLELEIITAKGNTRAVHTIGKADLKNRRIYGFFQDITERKQAEAEILKLNAELEQRVAERTLKLEAANKELEAFSYSVSHDLRAPLRHINGYVGLLNKGFRETLPEKAGHYLSQITDSASQMGTLIDDLLQFSRTGRQEMRQVDLDMNAAVQETLEKLKPDTKSRNISWSVAELPRIFGDYSLLQQVWINLLENAVKYTRDKDEAKIEVGCTREQDHWVFFIRDNGVGFDMQYAQKLFGVFQRLHSPTQFEGTGIGLAHVQRIVHKHGGRVWAEGWLDKGAVFYFTMPRNTFDDGGTS